MSRSNSPIFKKKRIETKTHKDYERKKELSKFIEDILEKPKRLQSIHKNLTKNIVFDEKLDMTHDINPSVLHQKNFNDWIKRRYHKSASTDYIYRPEEIRKRLALKAIFRNFDLDGNGKLELDEFIRGFVKTYITRTAKISMLSVDHDKNYTVITPETSLNSEDLMHMLINGPQESQYIKNKIDASKVFLHSDKWEEALELEKTENFIEDKKLETILNWISMKFSKFYLLVTKNDYLTLMEFIKISTDMRASSDFKDIMHELQGILDTMEIKPLRGLPSSFDVMVNFIGYLQHRNTLINKYRRMKDRNSQKAFEILIEIHEISPSMHSIDKINEYYNQEIDKRFTKTKNLYKKRKFEQKMKLQFGGGDLLELARVKFGYRPKFSKNESEDKEDGRKSQIEESRSNSSTYNSHKNSRLATLNSPSPSSGVRKNFLRKDTSEIDFFKVNQLDALKYTRLSKYSRKDSIVTGKGSQANHPPTDHLASFSGTVFGSKSGFFKSRKGKNHSAIYTLEMRKREKEVIKKRKQKWDQKLSKIITDTQKVVLSNFDRSEYASVKNTRNMRKQILLPQDGHSMSSWSIPNMTYSGLGVTRSNRKRRKKAGNQILKDNFSVRNSVVFKKTGLVYNKDKNRVVRRGKVQSLDFREYGRTNAFRKNELNASTAVMPFFKRKKRKGGSMANLKLRNL